jgi:hypothetical protein
MDFRLSLVILYIDQIYEKVLHQNVPERAGTRAHFFRLSLVVGQFSLSTFPVSSSIRQCPINSFSDVILNLISSEYIYIGMRQTSVTKVFVRWKYLI